METETKPRQSPLQTSLLQTPPRWRGLFLPESKNETGRLGSRPVTLLEEGSLPARQQAVLPAVTEVDDEPDQQPDDEPRPVGPTQAVDHREADHDPEGRRHRQHARLEGARDVGPLDAHDPDADADQDER